MKRILAFVLLLSGVVVMALVGSIWLHGLKGATVIGSRLLATSYWHARLAWRHDDD